MRSPSLKTSTSRPLVSAAVGSSAWARIAKLQQRIITANCRITLLKLTGIIPHSTHSSCRCFNFVEEIFCFIIGEPFPTDGPRVVCRKKGVRRRKQTTYFSRCVHVHRY